VLNALARIIALIVATTSMSGARTTEPVAPHAVHVVPRPTIHRGESFIARTPRPLPIRARPGAGPVVGWMPASSPFYRQPTHAWVLQRTPNGRYGLVPVPFVSRHRTGWIDLRGSTLARTSIRVQADLSQHLITVLRRGRVLFRTRAAIGAPASPTPVGRYFVTERLTEPRTSDYGSFIFALSGIQSHLPPGWTGGDQLAIHGTNEPWSIGRSVSAGCLRVSERALQRMKPLLVLGTPVVISK
jgi:lipoprotein-anchoring transpeptidase ErfK/SrfK